MDPLFRVREESGRNTIPKTVLSQIEARFELVVSGIDRIERASGLQYPAAYVEPSVIVSLPDPNSFQYGIMFARTIPLAADDRLRVVIQVSAPLVAYGLKGTIHAILAHEFLHYLELMRRISKMGIISDEVTGSIFESAYADETRLFVPGAVFNDRTLLRHITKKFPAGFRDHKLEDKTIKYWIEAGLPKTNVSLDSNTARLPATALANIRLEPSFVSKLEEIEQRSSKLKRRRLPTG